MKKTDEEIRAMFEVLTGHIADLLFYSFGCVVKDAEKNLTQFDAVLKTFQFAVSELEKSKYEFKIENMDKSRVCDSYTAIQ